MSGLLSLARSARLIRVLAAECPAPTTRTRRPANAARSRPVTSGQRRGDPVRGGVFAEGGQAGGAQRVAGGPGAGGVDDRGDRVVAGFAVRVFDPDHEGRGVAVPGVGLVHALPGHGDHAGAGLQPGGDRRQRGQRGEVAVDEFAAVGQRRRPGRFPAGGFEQADGGGVECCTATGRTAGCGATARWRRPRSGRLRRSAAPGRVRAGGPRRPGRRGRRRSRQREGSSLDPWCPLFHP